MLGRFIQADKTIPETGSNQAYDRYAYVENNPILYADLNGLEKVIIFYAIYDDGSNSFEAAANTQYQQALDQGYAAEDILMVQISTDVEFFDAIENSEIGEIEQIYVFSHGWDMDNDLVLRGGLQLGDHNEDDQQVTSKDFNNERRRSLENRFSKDSEFHYNACNIGNGTLPQTIADNFGSTVYAYGQPLKFFQMLEYPQTWNIPISIVPYLGNEEYSEYRKVFMSPSIGPGNITFPIPVPPKKFMPDR